MTNLPTLFAQDLKGLTFSKQWLLNDTQKDVSSVISFFLATFKSVHTKRCYFNDIKEFFEFLFQKNENIQTLDDLSEEMCHAWREHLKEANLKNSTLKRKINALSSLCSFALKRQLIKENPFEFVIRPRVPFRSETVAFTFEEVRNILQALKLQIQMYEKSDPKYARARLAFCTLSTLFSVGMRVQELCSLRIQSLQTMGDCYTLELLAKGDEAHAPIIHPQTAHILLEYQEEFRKEASKQDYLFVHPYRMKNSKAPITPKTVYNFLQEACQLASISKKVSPHSCRATLATLLHQQGIPIGDIQKFLNHKQITTTSLYIKKLEEEKESASLKIHFSLTEEKST
jgi:integrase/recombinase XerD